VGKARLLIRPSRCRRQHALRDIGSGATDVAEARLLIGFRPVVTRCLWMLSEQGGLAHAWSFRVRVRPQPVVASIREPALSSSAAAALGFSYRRVLRAERRSAIIPQCGPHQTAEESGFVSTPRTNVSLTPRRSRAPTRIRRRFGTGILSGRAQPANSARCAQPAELIAANRDSEKLERAKGFEPSTPTLARSCSTPELRPRSDPAG
jgi:hypothetical protein